MGKELKNNGIRRFIVAIIFMLIALFCCTVAFADTSGTCGDNLTWTMSDEGVLVISGTGMMKNPAPYWETSMITSVIIEDGVTDISSRVFEKCVNLTDVFIAGSVINIKDSAFYWCQNLTNVIILDGDHKVIGKSAFAGCPKLESVTMGDGVTDIGSYAFGACESLKSIIIPDSVRNIGDQAFYDCSSLTSVMGMKGVHSIGEKAFYGCVSLKDFYCPENITNIGLDAFPPRVSYNIHVSSLESWLSLNTANFSSVPNSYACKLYINNFELNNIIIPETITQIRPSAFMNFINITNVRIHNNVTSIGKDAFCGCKGITIMHIPDSVTRIESSAFANCEKLKSINIPDGVSFISSELFFGCSDLCEISIPDHITSIGSFAFYACSSLKEISIPDTVTTIGNEAFDGCRSLTSIHIPNGLKTIGQSTFGGCYGLTSIIIPDSVTSIGYYAFQSCINLRSVTFPDSVTTIDNYAFQGCSNLTKVNFSDHLQEIGHEAFMNCTSLKSITIPKGVEIIGRTAFASCPNLTMAIFLHPKDESSRVTFWENMFDSRTTIYCYSSSPVDRWAQEKYKSVEYLDNYEYEDLRRLYLPDDFNMQLNETLPLAADVFPNDGSEVTWSSSNPEIVSVINGVVTALDYGYATITATSGSVSDEVTIKVFQPATSFEFSSSEYWIEVNDNFKPEIINFQPEGADAKLTWESSDYLCARADLDGIVTAYKVGDATITATTENGITRSFIVHVTHSITSIKVKSAIVHKNDSVKMDVVANTSDGSYRNILLDYTSDRESYVVVDNHGVVTGLREGSAKITVKARRGGVSSTEEVYVLDHEGQFEIIEAIEPTCEEDGRTEGKTCTICGDITSWSEVIPALGHDWSEPEYTWDDNQTHFTASRVCSHGFHVESETVHGIRTLIKAPQESVIGGYRLTCEAFENDVFKQPDAVDIAIPALRDMTILKLPADLRVIEDEAFAGIDAQAVIIPTTVESIGSRAFADSDNLLYVVTYLSPDQIPADAFEGSDLVVLDYRE